MFSTVQSPLDIGIVIDIRIGYCACTIQGFYPPAEWYCTPNKDQCIKIFNEDLAATPAESFLSGRAKRFRL